MIIPMITFFSSHVKLAIMFLPIYQHGLSSATVMVRWMYLTYLDVKVESAFSTYMSLKVSNLQNIFKAHIPPETAFPLATQCK